MEDSKIEELVITGIRIGTIATIKKFGLSSEVVSRKKAYDLYERDIVENWRSKGWVTAYSSGNAKNSKVYFKRTELEMASAMLELGNTVTPNKIFKDFHSK